MLRLLPISERLRCSWWRPSNAMNVEQINRGTKDGMWIGCELSFYLLAGKSSGTVYCGPHQSRRISWPLPKSMSLNADLHSVRKDILRASLIFITSLCPARNVYVALTTVNAVAPRWEHGLAVEILTRRRWNRSEVLPFKWTFITKYLWKRKWKILCFKTGLSKIYPRFVNLYKTASCGLSRSAGRYARETTRVPWLRFSTTAITLQGYRHEEPIIVKILCYLRNR